MNLLTHLERAGSYAEIPEDFDRFQLALFLQALRGAGHAVVANEVFEHGSKSGAIIVTHYRTCLACVGAR